MEPQASSGSDNRHYKFEDESRKLLNEIVTRITIMETRFVIIEEMQRSITDISKRLHQLEIAHAISSELRPQKVSLWIKIGGIAASVAFVLGLVNISNQIEERQQKQIENSYLRNESEKLKLQQDENVSTIKILEDEIKMLSDAR